ncbi:MAG: hypothetical protein RBT78_10105 [Kiritimatiellia bacterium]|jgi:hypothetical protein|nr:hypothetical protein [Kiritimatiellia bacterium]
MRLALLTALAQENAVPVAAEAVPAAVQEGGAAPAKIFDPLVRMMNVLGVCEVKTPDAEGFAPARNNKYYPLGTVFRTGLGGSALLVFSPQESVKLSADTEVSVTAPEKNPEARVLRFRGGAVKTSLRDNLQEGLFAIETPSTTCRNVAGRGEYTLACDATLETFQAATITGAARVEGAQYHIPALRAANTVNIQNAPDRTLTRLTSVSGDFPIVLENGTETPVTFGMTPKAVVKIWRENAPVGGRPIISTLVVSPTGIARHRFVYAEGRPDLTTGELIVPADAELKEEALPVLLSGAAQESAAPAVAAPAADGQKEP